MEEERTYVEGESEFRAWDELPLDILVNIFNKLWLWEVVRVISMVCKSWGRYLKEPECWQTIDIDNWCCVYEDREERYDYMLRSLVARSSGCLCELSVSYANDDQMLFIAENAGATLQNLTLNNAYITDSIAEQLSSKLPELTTLDLSCCREISPQAMESIGRNCQKLVSLTWGNDYALHEDQPQDSVAYAIGCTMPNLKHLRIAEFRFGTYVALEILEGCPELKTLDLGSSDFDNLDPSLLEEKYPNITVLREVYSDGDYEDDGTDYYPLGEDVWF